MIDTLTYFEKKDGTGSVGYYGYEPIENTDRFFKPDYIEVNNHFYEDSQVVSNDHWTGEKPEKYEQENLILTGVWIIKWKNK